MIAKMNNMMTTRLVIPDFLQPEWSHIDVQTIDRTLIKPFP